MYYHKLSKPNLICLIVSIFIALYILLVTRSKDTTNLNYYDNENSQINNLQEFNFSQILCNEIFDVYKYGNCIGVPGYCCCLYPEVYDGRIYCFSLYPHRYININNNNKITKCHIDGMILYILIN